MYTGIYPSTKDSSFCCPPQLPIIISVVLTYQAVSFCHFVEAQKNSRRNIS